MTNQQYEQENFTEPQQDLPVTPTEEHAEEADGLAHEGLDEPVDAPEEAQDEQPPTQTALQIKKPWYTSRVAKVAALGSAVAIGVGIGSSLQRDSTPESTGIEQTDDEQTQASTNDSSGTADTDGGFGSTEEDAQGDDSVDFDNLDDYNYNEEVEPPESEYPPNSLYNPEVVSEEIEPTLLTAEQPEELLDQYMQNRSCMLNADSLHLESLCIEATLGNSTQARLSIEGTRQWIEDNREYTQRIRDGRQERGEEPYYVKQGWEMVDAWHEDRPSPGEGHIMKIQVKINTDWSPINHPGNDRASNMILTFQRTNTSSEAMRNFESDRDIWLQRGEEELVGREDL